LCTLLDLCVSLFDYDFVGLGKLLRSKYLLTKSCAGTVDTAETVPRQVFNILRLVSPN